MRLWSAVEIPMLSRMPPLQARLRLRASAMSAIDLFAKRRSTFELVVDDLRGASGSVCSGLLSWSATRRLCNVLAASSRDEYRPARHGAHHSCCCCSGLTADFGARRATRQIRLDSRRCLVGAGDADHGRLRRHRAGDAARQAARRRRHAARRRHDRASRRHHRTGLS